MKEPFLLLKVPLKHFSIQKDHLNYPSRRGEKLLRQGLSQIGHLDGSFSGSSKGVLNPGPRYIGRAQSWRVLTMHLGWWSESGAAVQAALGIWFIHACCDISDRMNEIRRGLVWSLVWYGTFNGARCTQVRLLNQALGRKENCPWRT